MFERRTERSRRVVFWARYAASLGGSPEIEPEHLLLGLLREDISLARRFLGSPFALDAVWKRVGQSKVVREHPLAPGDHLILSEASKRVLAFAEEEADQFSNKRIGSAQLLLGLLREEKCLAAEILHDGGVRLVPAREELARTPHDDSVTEEFVRVPLTTYGSGKLTHATRAIPLYH